MGDTENAPVYDVSTSDLSDLMARTRQETDNPVDFSSVQSMLPPNDLATYTNGLATLKDDLAAGQSELDSRGDGSGPTLGTVTSYYVQQWNDTLSGVTNARNSLAQCPLAYAVSNDDINDLITRSRAETDNAVDFSNLHSPIEDDLNTYTSGLATLTNDIASGAAELASRGDGRGPTLGLVTPDMMQKWKATLDAVAAARNSLQQCHLDEQEQAQATPDAGTAQADSSTSADAPTGGADAADDEPAPDLSEAQITSEIFEFFWPGIPQPDYSQEAGDFAAFIFAQAVSSSRDMDWVPHAPGFKPGVGYIVLQAVQIAWRKIRRKSEIYESVRSTVANNFRTPYDELRNGLSPTY